ncbi:MAG: putative dehydrogenase, partial [Chthonomonadales bacterium]|nr:putative dehydrogenase [Chthonomonadales bacterium]
MSEDGKLGVALLSFAHVHAGGYADQVRAHEECRIVLVWDDDAERGATQAEKYGVPFIPDLDDALAHADVEAVVCNAPTSMHRDILVKAANLGKHIFTEKSLTITTDDATEVLQAVEASGIKFMISLPSRMRPEILFAKKVLEEGLLGEITTMRTRIAHMAALDRWFSGGTAWFGDQEQA